MAEKCDACNGRLEEDFISDYASMAVDQRPCGKCRGDGILRTGPYRLADGTWSDGVDRTSMIKLHKFHIENPSRPIVIQTWDQRQDGGYDWVAIESKYAEPEYFRTHAEAIAYADRMARTNQGENNEQPTRQPAR